MVKRSNKNKKQIDAIEEEEVVFTVSEYDKNKNRI
jgi:hypothetical protein